MSVVHLFILVTAPKVFIRFLCVALAIVVVSMTDADRALFHSLTGPSSGVSPFVALHDTPLANNIAFTTADRNNIYVDFEKLRAAPHTKWNVFRHEIAHTKGANHGDGTPEMAYMVTESQNGVVVDDAFFI